MLIKNSLLCNVPCMKPSVAYNYLKKCYTQDRFMLNSDEVLNPLNLHEISLRNDSYYTRPALIKWLNWVNKNIILELGCQTYKTIDVRLRIAANMLDKVPLCKNDRLDIMVFVTTNVRVEMSNISTEDLPF